MIPKQHIVQILMELSPICPDLRRTMESDGFKNIAVESWQKALSDMPLKSVRVGADWALRCHNERNITPAHIRKYHQAALQDPRFMSKRIEANEKAFLLEQQDAMENACPMIVDPNSDNEMEAKGAKFLLSIGVGVVKE